MVGGTVAGVRLMSDGNTCIVVEGTGHDRNRETVRVVKGHHGVKPGDGVWWQCGKVIWTPKGNRPVGPGQGTKWDIVLEAA